MSEIELKAEIELLKLDRDRALTLYITEYNKNKWIKQEIIYLKSRVLEIIDSFDAKPFEYVKIKGNNRCLK